MKMEINKFNLVFFIIALNIFNVLISLAKDQNSTTNNSLEMRYKILDNHVYEIIENNLNLDTLDLIKLIAQKIIPILKKELRGNLSETAKTYIHKGLNRALKSRDIDINQKDKNGDSLLMTVIKNGDIKIAKFLIAAGADVNNKNKYEQTALMEAAKSGKKNLIKLLIDAGVDIDNKDIAENTALNEAILHGYKDIAELLIKSGANINSRNELGKTALMLAIKIGHKDLVKLLIDSGANLKKTDINGNTALSLANMKEDEDIIKLLKEKS